MMTDRAGELGEVVAAFLRESRIGAFATFGNPFLAADEQGVRYLLRTTSLRRVVED